MSDELELDNAGTVERYSVRVPCTACGRLYALPKGAARAPGGVGPCCQSELLERPSRLLEAPAVELVDDEPRGEILDPPPFEDRLCEGCRNRPAAGVLSPPGVALCVDCADELLEHWLVWLDDPTHDWWPTDDPFASALHPVQGWRSMELEDGRVRS